MSTMDSTQHVLEDTVSLDKDYKSVTGVPMEDEVLEIAFNGLLASQEFKQPRMNQIAQFQRLYNNDITPKLRQLFNVPVPVFSGMLDTMAADFNDEVNLKFKATNTSQLLIVPKIQAHWEVERDSMSPNAMWNYKARTDRMNALMCGRGILLNYAENVPTYRNVLETIDISDFHFQPMGGGILENHLFCGREGIIRTMEDIVSDETFDKAQVKKLKEFSFQGADWMTINTTYGTKLTRFTSLALDINKASYTGTRTVNLCEFIVTYKGARFLVTFDPVTKIWLRVKKWTDIRPSGKYPYITWATHEDAKNFLSKAYADDLYWVADTIITMVNQELTNREKKNYNARAFDEDMFTDVQKLDEAQYMPDTLVPVKTGAKQISQGIYEFQTPELQGTINLVSFMAQFTGQQVGITGGSQGNNEKSKKPTVVIAESQQISKRTGLRSDSYREAYAQLGDNYYENLREYMPPRLSIQMIGENGFIEESELKRIDVRRAGNIGISTTSTSEQENRDNTKRQSHINAITMVAQNPNLSKYEKEVIYRDIGQFDDNEVGFLLDSQNYESKKQIAHASKNIQAMLLGKPTDVYYGAEITYLTYIENYLIDNKNLIMGKEQLFIAHLREMFQIVAANMQRKAKQMIMKKTLESFLQAQAPTGPVAPTPATEGGNMETPAMETETPDAMPGGMANKMQLNQA